MSSRVETAHTQVDMLTITLTCCRLSTGWPPSLNIEWPIYHGTVERPSSRIMVNLFAANHFSPTLEADSFPQVLQAGRFRFSANSRLPPDSIPPGAATELFLFSFSAGLTVLRIESEPDVLMKQNVLEKLN